MRLLLWLLGGVLLGLVIHIVVILALPTVASDTMWARLAAPMPRDKIEVLPAPAPGAPNPLGLDPLLTYAACRISLEDGPGVVSGALPGAPWSFAIFNPAGTVVYSTTNRDGVGKNLDLGIFNADQTHLLAEQKIDVADGQLIVEADEPEVLVVVRLPPPYQVMRARYEQILGKLSCGNLPMK